MSRKIVIIPEFAASHLLKCWIPNMIQTINPDIIIINSGLFPNGPENKGHVDEVFREKWCYKNTNAGFDYDDTLDIVTKWTTDKYAGNVTIPHIECRIINYDIKDANNCFIKAISMPELFAEGDIIFPIEPDAFIYEGDMDIINEEISKLKPGEGIQCRWVDFLETQYYTEAINLEQPKYRRFCYCFNNIKNYKKAMDGFMSQSYPKLKKTESFFVRHYPWFVYDKWKELRYDLIYRSDPQYWKNFEKGLQEIRNVKVWDRINHVDGSITDIRNRDIPERITIRPSRQDAGRYAQFIDVEHPEAIKNHPNYVR